MGDLKKKHKTVDFEYVIDDEFLQQNEEYMNDQTIEQLRTYMKEFYEIQKNKNKNKKKE